MNLRRSVGNKANLSMAMEKMKSGKASGSGWEDTCV